MTNRTHTGFLLVVLVAALAGCEGASPTPTAPSAAQPQQPPAPASGGRDTYSVADVILSGVVYEVTPMGRVPIEGVGFSRITSMFSPLPTPLPIHRDSSASGACGPARVHGPPGWMRGSLRSMWIKTATRFRPGNQPPFLAAASAQMFPRIFACEMCRSTATRDSTSSSSGGKQSRR
jgi:hypothetical protein